MREKNPEAPGVVDLASAVAIGASAVSSKVEIEPTMPEVAPAGDASKELWEFAESFPFVDGK